MRVGSYRCVLWIASGVCSREAAGCALGWLLGVLSVTGSVLWEGLEMMGAQQGDLEDLRPLSSGNTKQKQRVSTGAVDDSAGGEGLLHLRWRSPLMPVRLSLHGALRSAQGYPLR